MRRDGEDCGGGSQALAAARGAAIRYAPSLPLHNTPMLLSLCNVGPTLSCYRKLRIPADVCRFKCVCAGLSEGTAALS